MGEPIDRRGGVAALGAQRAGEDEAHQERRVVVGDGVSGVNGDSIAAVAPLDVGEALGGLVRQARQPEPQRSLMFTQALGRRVRCFASDISIDAGWCDVSLSVWLYGESSGY